MRVGVTKWLLLFLLSALDSVTSMEDVWVELRAPRFVVHGHSAVLRCEHNVEPQTLYKVVFFKSGQRIMQYVQGRDPPFERYNFTGADINLMKMTPTSITLEKMDFTASGPYACEIALEIPLYSKASKIHEVSVIVRQKYRPKIKIKHKKLSSNDDLQATCQSAPAHPAPHLTWLINNVKHDTRGHGNSALTAGFKKSVRLVLAANTAPSAWCPPTQLPRCNSLNSPNYNKCPYGGRRPRKQCISAYRRHFLGSYSGSADDRKNVDESLTIPHGTVNVHRHHHGMTLSLTNSSLRFPLTSLQLYPNQTVDITCLSTIPSYASIGEGFADIQNHTVTVNVIRMGSASVPTQLPVKIVSAEQSRSSHIIDNYYVCILNIMTIFHIVIN